MSEAVVNITDCLSIEDGEARCAACQQSAPADDDDFIEIHSDCLIDGVCWAEIGRDVHGMQA